MAWFIGQSAVMILLAFLIGLLVGWLIWGQLRRAAPAAVVEPAAVVVEPAAVVAEPVVIAEPATPVHIPAPRTESASEPVAEPVEAEVPEPHADLVPVAALIDDLARIEGIGPKISAALVAAGIRTFAGLAESTEDELTKAIGEAGITFAPSMYTWAQQARLLADGDEEGFLALTDYLIAGRVPDGAEPAIDDLERIEGIGPKMSAALLAAGIRTYHALAGSNETELRTAIENAGLTFAPSLVTWARQAQLLADGDEEGFADLTRRLVAGRDEGRL